MKVRVIVFASPLPPSSIVILTHPSESLEEQKRIAKRKAFSREFPETLALLLLLLTTPATTTSGCLWMCPNESECVLRGLQFQVGCGQKM